MKKIMSLKDSFIGFTAVKDVQEICRPLTDCLGIDFFCYHKIYDDGSEILLTNNEAWAKHVHTHNLIIGSNLANELFLSDFKSVLWPANHNVSLLLELHEVCQWYYGMTFLYKNTEYFGFGVKGKQQALIANKLLNHTDLLERFCLYFRERAEKLILTTEKDKVLHIKTEEKPAFIKNIENIQSLRENFIQQTPIRKLIIENEMIDEGFLTQKETESLKCLLHGMTSSQIAKELNRSKRTVESHLENIKNKLNCATRSDLIQLVISKGLAKHLL